jgi:hypothetical protein
MGAGLKENGTRAFVAVTAVCAALSPAALAAVGGESAERRDDGKATRLVRVAPERTASAACAPTPRPTAERNGWTPGRERAGRPGRQ